MKQRVTDVADTFKRTSVYRSTKWVNGLENGKMESDVKVILRRNPKVSATRGHFCFLSLSLSLLLPIYLPPIYLYLSVPLYSRTEFLGGMR